MGIFDVFYKWFGRGGATEQPNRKRRADENYFGSPDAKNRRIEGTSSGRTYIDSTWTSSLNKVDPSSQLTTGSFHISKWNQNGKENRMQYVQSSYDFPNVNTMSYQGNIQGNSTDEIQVLDELNNGASSKPRNVHRSKLPSAQFSKAEVGNGPDLEIVDFYPNSLKNKGSKTHDNDVQIIRECVPKERYSQSRSSVKRTPFKAIESPRSSVISSTPIMFSSRLLNKQPEIQILPATSMGSAAGNYQYRSQSSLLSSDSNCSRNQSTLKHIKHAEERMTYSGVLQMFSDRSKPNRNFMVPSVPRHPATSNEKVRDFNSSHMLQRHHFSPPEAPRDSYKLSSFPSTSSSTACERITIQVDKNAKQEPSTSASRLPSNDADLMCIGEVVSKTKMPIKSGYGCEFVEEILFKYAENDRRCNQEIQEETAKAKLLEERNRLAKQERSQKFEIDLHEQLKNYLKLTEELPGEKDGEEIPSLPELTKEMQDEISRALSAGPDDVIVRAFNLVIKGRDIRTLKPPEWLNDEVINFYMNLLVERGKADNYPAVHAFNTFFFPKLESAGYDSLKRWTRKVDVFSHDFLLVPVHRGMHWCMAIINMKEKQILYYDSMNGKFNKCLELLFEYLQKESIDKRKSPFDTTGWTKDHAEGIPQQNNGSDCGMFACMYAEYVSRGAPITFTQADMPYFRRKVVYEILKVKLLC